MASETINRPPLPRISVEISQEHNEALAKIFEHGERKLYFTAVIEATINIHKRLGKEALYLMMQGRADIIQAMAVGINHARETKK